MNVFGGKKTVMPTTEPIKSDAKRPTSETVKAAEEALKRPTREKAMAADEPKKTEKVALPDMSKMKDLSMSELQTMMVQMNDMIEKRKNSEKKEVLQQIRKLVEDHELSYDDVIAVIRTKAKRGKAPALYRNPERKKQTWSGKGEAPDWFKNHPNPESLRIKGA